MPPPGARPVRNQPARRARSYYATRSYSSPRRVVRPYAYPPAPRANRIRPTRNVPLDEDDMMDIFEQEYQSAVRNAGLDAYEVAWNEEVARGTPGDSMRAHNIGEVAMARARYAARERYNDEVYALAQEQATVDRLTQLNNNAVNRVIEIADDEEIVERNITAEEVELDNEGGITARGVLAENPTIRLARTQPRTFNLPYGRS